MENSGSVIAEIFRVRINFNAQIMLIKLRLHTSARTRMYASDAYALTQSLKHIVIITELLSSPICLVNMYNPMWVRIIAARQVSSQKLHRKLLRNVVSWCSYFFMRFWELRMKLRTRTETSQKLCWTTYVFDIKESQFNLCSTPPLKHIINSCKYPYALCANSILLTYSKQVPHRIPQRTLWN